MPNRTIVSRLVSLMCLLRERAKTIPTSRSFSVMHMQALHFIRVQDGCLMHDVAKYLAIKPPSATALVAHLIGRNLVKREVDAGDRRVIRLRATPAGRRLLAKRFDEFSRAMDGVLKRLTVEETQELIILLDRILSQK